MIAMTISPGATTAAARLIWPFACGSPPPAATSEHEGPQQLGEQPPALEPRIL
jgi:hypothetical protein